VEISFAFALPPDQFADFELHRQLRDERGAVLDDAILWTGPALQGQAGMPGVLNASGGGFTFLDRVAYPSVTEGAGLSYSLKAVTGDGFDFVMDSLDGPDDLSAHLNTGPLLALSPAWPNPANPGVNVSFRASPAENVTVRVMDLRGALVREIYQGPGTGDWQTLIWNGRDDRGAAAASGLYLIRLENGETALNQSVILAR
jgi:hypothetical protein